MQAFTHFSKHAFKRIAERTRLPCEEIASILDRRLTVNTGHEPGFNRNHLLFYSAADDNYFVAIQDALTGTIVTILPLDYHANLAWKISPNDCGRARDIYINATAGVTTPKSTSNSKVFIISGIFLDGAVDQKVKVIKKIDAALYGNDLKQLLSDQCFWDGLGPLFAQKDIKTDCIFGVSIRYGNRGAPVLFDLRELQSLITALQWDAPRGASD